MHDHPKFEQPIYDLIHQIEQLKNSTDGTCVNTSEQITALNKKLDSITQSIYKSLSPWQIVQLARHPLRPKALDVIDSLFDSFFQLHGDRHLADCQSIIGGIARFNQLPIMVLAQHKGRDINERVKHNFGMANPEGYRKCKRLMLLAEKFNLPVVCFIDTPGAYPGIDAEKHNQCEAIANNLMTMSNLKTPIVSIVLGEAMSGGAIAMGVADRVLMMEYAIYSVISPEGCASILWKDTEMAQHAAESMNLTAPDLLQAKIIDSIIKEPIGGAHRNHKQCIETIRHTLTSELNLLTQNNNETLVNQRQQKLRNLTSNYYAL
ncbi:MAG TPA: acetyl-CoA carboxylase carboxyltransferase subunit alpha [Gammaproteobacteria bacterium]|nr:acetyl-CoA carboxylase carboxyltransferase subunit alpha [Gammaproteobacteria bacterium]